MLILDQHRLIVMLPQKCGTETLQRRLGDLHSCSDVGSSPYYNAEAKRYLSKHVTISTARGLDAYKKRATYRKACFVRNPYDRVYSWFSWERDLCVRSAVLSGKQPYAIAGKLDADDASHERTKRQRSSLKTKMEAANSDFNQYVKNSPKKYKPMHRFTHSRLRRNQMDFIGYIERFEDDFQQLCRKYDISVDSSESGHVIGALKASCDPHQMERNDYKSLDYYNSETVRFVNKRFKCDFKYYGYQMLNPQDFPEKLSSRV
jgi:hypothetical protein